MTMTAREYEILKNAGVPNNLYYNKTVGSPVFKTVNLALVEEIKEKFNRIPEVDNCRRHLTVYKFVLKI